MAELNLNQIEEKLNKEFAGEGRRIVFWYDENGDFADDVDNLQLNDAKIHHLTERNQFRTKVLLEREDKTSNYLLYGAFAKPPVVENHLEDILLYSKRFYADRISLICADLGIKEELKPVLVKYQKYFAAKERAQRFYDIGLETFTEDSIELALICCVCKNRVSSFDEALCKILLAGDLVDNEYLAELQKYDLLVPFWKQCEKVFGFAAVDKTLDKLLISLFTTYAEKTLQDKLPETWYAYLATKQGSVIAFMDSFMNNVLYRERYDELSEYVEKILNVQSVVGSLGAEAVLNLDCFKCVDKVILIWLMERLLLEDLGAELNGKGIKEICSLRGRLHFASLTNAYYGMFSSAYEIIRMAKYVPANGFSNVLKQYVEEDYKVDYWYRQFYTYLDSLTEPMAFAKLQQLVENIYSNEYLGKLVPSWNEEVVDVISAKSEKMQKDFYNRFVKEERDRIVVIISDALRYEVAKQLYDKLGDEERCKERNLQTQLSVLPSYTALGMAALLPHKKITMSDDFKVLVNDRKCASLAEREKILQEVEPNGICIQFDELKNMKREELRTTFAGKQVVYVYHNQIDARGDAAKTQDEVFVACQEAVEEIYALLCRLPVSASVVKFVVTADHGFIYQRHNIEENEKISANCGGYVNHRFVIADKPVNSGSVGSVKLGSVLRNDDERFVSYPLGTEIFKVAGGGTNYVHGGSSPQEMIVPVLSVKMDRGHVETRQATITLHTIINKITSKDINLVFVQTEAVSDTVKPATYKLCFVDVKGKAVSNEVSIIADSKNSDMSSRMTTVRFSFINTEYDSRARYYLVTKEATNDVEMERKEFVIDMPFVGNFGFDF